MELKIEENKKNINLQQCIILTKKSILLLVLLFLVRFEMYSQTNDPYSLKKNDRQITALINACMSKTSFIEFNCISKHLLTGRAPYLLKILPVEGTDSLMISLTYNQLRFYVWPLSNVYGYYNAKGYPVFVMKSDVIKNTEIRRIQTSIDVITVMADSVLVIDTNLLFPADCYHVLYTFTFHKNLLKNKTGSVNYRVYYPVTQISRQYWPVEFRDYLPYYRYIFEYERARVPWESCNCMECGPNYQFIRTPEEIEKMKHGTFEVNLRKWKNPIIE